MTDCRVTQHRVSSCLSSSITARVPSFVLAGGFLAWLVYRYLGLKFVSKSWFNLDATWAFSLVLVGALSLAVTLSSHR